jgi:hypothetical protein
LKSVSADIWRQPAQETKHSSAENSGQKPSALDLLPQASAADKIHSTLLKTKDSGC